MNQKVKLLQGITLSGEAIDAGETIELPKKSAVALIKEGLAEDTSDPNEDLRKALDKKYKADELKTEAEKVGVTFAESAVKADVIEAIIEQQKADLLL